MYIEFKLPHTGGAYATAHAIQIAIARWAKKYDVPQHDYSEKTIKYTHRLGFNKEKYFSLFSLTWDYFVFKIIDVGNEKY
jgi:hypothetical protein